MSLENLHFFPYTPKLEVFTTVRHELDDLGLDITQIDSNRPWGGFFRIHDDESKYFTKLFFDQELELKEQTISPKILVVAPEQRLSWQMHERRAEIWQVVSGPVDVMINHSDRQPKNSVVLNTGHIWFIPVRARHRLIGANNWGVVAEIWQHTDPNNLSDENDIRRIEDDFGRVR